MTAHARLSASGSERWINCAGSVEAEAGHPNTSSAASAEGTCAHELAELVLENGGNCHDWEGKTLIANNQYTVGREMCDYVQQYVDYVRSIKGEHSYEQRVDFSDWVAHGFGTADTIVIEGTTAHIIDLKYGKGVWVGAENNTQGLLYALGVLSDLGMIYDLQKFNITIVQPRLDNISEWSISRADLMAWGEWVSQRAEEANSPNAKRTPGEKQCQWCKAKATCPALADFTKRITMADFEQLDELPLVTKLPDAQLSEILAAKKLITSWLDAVESHVSERLNKGESFEGWKMVAGRSLRLWANPEDAERVLSDALDKEAFSRKLISPAQAEKALGKSRTHLLEGLISKPEGKPTLAPASDPRPSVTTNADDFDAC